MIALVPGLDLVRRPVGRAVVRGAVVADSAQENLVTPGHNRFKKCEPVSHGFDENRPHFPDADVSRLLNRVENGQNVVAVDANLEVIRDH